MGIPDEVIERRMHVLAAELNVRLEGMRYILILYKQEDDLFVSWAGNGPSEEQLVVLRALGRP